MLGTHGRGLTRALFTPLALALARTGVTPNALTVLGTVMSVGVAVAFLPRGSFVAGPLLLAVVLVADSFDGILARATGRTSAFGAFLDSTMDRLADGAVFASLAAWAALRMAEGTLRTITVALALAAVVLAATVPYARARAESVGRQRLHGHRRAHRPAAGGPGGLPGRGTGRAPVGAHPRPGLGGAGLLHHRHPAGERRGPPDGPPPRAH